MDYKEHYDKLISTRKLRERVTGVYYERHHIVPTSMGGEHSEENLVYLTAREHFIAHWLLWRIHRNRKMSTAFILMCRKTTSSRAYAEARESQSLTKMSSKTRKKISDYAKTRIGSKNSFFGKTFSDDQKEKWSIERTGKPCNNGLNKSVTINEVEYDSICKASSSLSIPVTTILFRCKSKTKTFSNYNFLNK